MSQPQANPQRQVNSSNSICVVQQPSQPSTQLVLPSDKTLQQATKLALKTKKPVCFYFYIES